MFIFFAWLHFCSIKISLNKNYDAVFTVWCLLIKKKVKKKNFWNYILLIVTHQCKNMFFQHFFFTMLHKSQVHLLGGSYSLRCQWHCIRVCHLPSVYFFGANILCQTNETNHFSAALLLSVKSSLFTEFPLLSSFLVSSSEKMKIKKKRNH